MIPVEEALLVAEERAKSLPVAEAMDEEIFSIDEHTQLGYLDATLEAGVYKTFTGRPFDFRIPAKMCAARVVEALAERWKRAGWQTAIFLIPSKNDVTGEIEPHYQLLLACPRRIEVVEEQAIVEKLEPAPKTLAPIVIGQTVPVASSRTRLLIRMPTRQRPEQAVWVLEKYRRMAGIPVQIEVVVDDDDESMRRAEVLQRLAALDCTVTVGRHRSKVEACNGGRVSEWDAIMLASDDMVPLCDGYAQRIVEEMEKSWPHFDGALCFNDGHQRPDNLGVPLCTLPIFGRKLYDQFGYIYDPSYKSLFCDREQTDVLHAMGRIAYVDEQLIEHRHHIWGRSEKDALYERNDALEGEDRATYERRRELRRPGAQWGFDSPPLCLSVLICTVPKRRVQLDWLLRHLWAQILSPVDSFRFQCSFSDPREVEVLVDSREGVTVGEKRQSLLERARGHFVAFIDDDDGIAHDYVERVVGAIKTNPNADCASFEGVITSRGANPQRFTHSIKHDGWYTRDGVHYRTPNHLNAIRRDLAIAVGFVGKNVGEDHEFSKRVRSLLVNEVSTGDAPLYFYWHNPEQSVQAK